MSVALQGDREGHLHLDLLRPARRDNQRDVKSHTFWYRIVLPGFTFAAEGTWRVWIESDMDGRTITKGSFVVVYKVNGRAAFKDATNQTICSRRENSLYGEFHRRALDESRDRASEPVMIEREEEEEEMLIA